MQNKYYTQHEGKVIKADTKHKLVMAIALDPRTGYRQGLVRCITSREGDITVSGYTDRSELHLIEGSSPYSYEIKGRVEIINEKEVIETILEDGFDFIGLEDPEIWIDEKTDMMHLYVTIPLIHEEDFRKNKIYLGHAEGKDLGSLTMTMPVIKVGSVGMEGGAKEPSIAPLNSHNVRLNLVESSEYIGDTYYSIIRVAKATDMGKKWEAGDVVFHPSTANIPWAGGHGSPGPLFPRSFMDMGPGKLLGVMNGREANTRVGDEVRYNRFSIGLYVYDYENGRIDWISPERFISDSEARTITFASQFVPTGLGRGILYAHVDDSFVRAYELDAEKIRLLLPT